MAQVIKKENMTISIREYKDNQGNTKKVWKTIGELITWDDGKQSFETWGPAGSTKGSIFEQQEQGGQQQQNQQQAPQQSAQQQAPQYHQTNQQQPQQQQNNNYQQNNNPDF